MGRPLAENGISFDSRARLDYTAPETMQIADGVMRVAERG
jgi:hypothetical protein